MYNKWLNFVQQHTTLHDHILDVACGTGKLVNTLAKLKYYVDGLDLSADMLSIASQHAISNQVMPNFFQENMLDLSVMNNYDVITCFDDSLNYLNNSNEILKAFNEVYKHLKNNGKYLFDVISPYQTDVVYPGYMYNYRDENHAFMWQSYVGKFPHSIEHDLTFFDYNRQKDAYDEYSGLHRERTYPLKLYLRLLQQSGFVNIQPSADFGYKSIDNKTTRYFFVCEKGPIA